MSKKSKPVAKSVPKVEQAIVEAAATTVEPIVATVVDAPAEAPAPEATSAAPKAVVTTVEQNGIKRPGADTLCGRVWKALDDLRAAGVDATAKNAAAAFDGVAIAGATIRTQYARWRKYHEIARAARPAPPATRIDGSVDEHVS